MAMKVSKTAVHRLAVDMSCGCRMYAEFLDVQCKQPVTLDEGAETAVKVFTPCDKHNTQDVIEFIIGERLEEAILTAQATPVAPVHMHPIPQDIEEGETGGVTATGERVQTIARVNKPKAVRPRNETGVKTLQRSPQELAKAGASLKVASGTAEIQIDEVAEDNQITPHIDDVMDFLDPKEEGLFEEE